MLLLKFLLEDPALKGELDECALSALEPPALAFLESCQQEIESVSGKCDTLGFLNYIRSLAIADNALSLGFDFGD